MRAPAELYIVVHRCQLELFAAPGDGLRNQRLMLTSIARFERLGQLRGSSGIAVLP